MSLRRQLTSGLRALFHRDAVERDLDDEMRHYLEMAVESRVRAGMTRAAAERAARIEIGSIEAAKDEVRSGGWESVVETVWHDFNYAARGLRRNMGFTTIAVLTLALGIGANTAMFSVVRGVILRPLPYPDPGRLAMVWTDDAKRDLHEETVAYPTYLDWRAGNKSFGEMAIMHREVATLLDDGEPTRTVVEQVSPNFFSVMSVLPEIGRPFTVAEEVDREPVVVLSHALWMRRFAGSQDVIGKSMEIFAGKNGPRTVQVIGVMPATFDFPAKDVELWEPATAYWRFAREQADRVCCNTWQVIGRLRDGARISDARREMDAIGRRLEALYPVTKPDHPGYRANVVPLLEQITGKNLQVALWILLGTVVVVLLIACVNVANLLLARDASRARELAVRTSLGAGRLRIARQLMTENALLAALGGGVGVALAVGAVRVIRAFAPSAIPRLAEARIDAPVLMFTVAACVLSGLVFGVMPAWSLARRDASEVLKEGSSATTAGRAVRRARGVLVVAECAMAVVLLAAAGLLVRSMIRVSANPLGFNPDHVLVARVEHTRNVRGAAAAGNVLLVNEAASKEVFDRIAALPGVERVGGVSRLILSGGGDESITVEGREPSVDGRASGQLAMSSVTPGFFETMGAQLVRGRFFTRNDALAKIRYGYLTVEERQLSDGLPDRPTAEAAVVNAAFVRRYFPNEDPIGKRFYIGPPKVYWYQIVGVVGDMRRQGLEREPIPEYYGPGIGWPMDIVVRTEGDPLRLAPSIRGIVQSVQRHTAVLSTSSADRQLGDLTAQRRFQTWLLAAFAATALLLAAIGIYGVLQYMVAQRRHEIGIRIALGASTGRALRHVIGEGMRLAIGGVAIGIVLALVLTRVMASLLFDTSPADPLTYAVVAATLGAVAFCACYFPARRAAAVDPIIALRHE